MDFTEAIAYIHGTDKFGSKLGLNNITELMARLGNPQKGLNIVHVAGTNGKGSFVAFLSGILTAAGYRTGAFISPYLQRFNERIKIDGKEISGADVARLASLVKEQAERMAAEGGNHPTEFEIVTAMAFMYYARQRCDAVVLEVGLGGRLDATNVIECPALAVIMSIGYDHTHILGSALADIAFEKAGIIKAGGDVLTYEEEGEAATVFEAVCAERGAKLWRPGFTDIRPEGFGLDGQRFRAAGWGSLNISLLGAHQLKNAVMALKAVEILRGKGFRIDESAVKAGLAGARWPGRFEMISRSPLVVIDGAHNEQGAQTLAENLKIYFPGKKFVFIVGVLADKDYETMLTYTLPLAETYITVTPDSPRAVPADKLSEFLNGLGSGGRGGLPAKASSDVKSAIAEAVSLGGPICVFGSLYILGDVRQHFGLK